MNSNSIKIPTLGKHFTLGEAYDARVEEGTGSILWTGKAIEDATLVEPVTHSKISYTECSSFSEKASLIDISAHLKLSVLGGLVKLEGSGAFLKDTEKSTKSSSVVLRFEKKTKKKLLRYNE